MLALAIVVLPAGPAIWADIESSGHVYTEAQVTAPGGPSADVALVLGAQIEPNGTEPMAFLRGRLDTAAALLASGRVRVLLVSGDEHGSSGDETDVMSAYLQRAGVSPSKIVVDPYGLDTYDSCTRARQVYGITRTLVVTQQYHLARAVTLCRHAGIVTDGVEARCDGCYFSTLAQNKVREYFAYTKAAWDAGTNRAPAIASPPSSAITDALGKH